MYVFQLELSAFASYTLSAFWEQLIRVLFQMNYLKEMIDVYWKAFRSCKCWFGRFLAGMMTFDKALLLNLKPEI